MEKVQFQLEATLPELKDLYEKRLFSKNEIDQITKRRTAFETSLIRRQTRKDDFFKYAEYEINLELLRKARWKRLKYNINPPPPSASTYSLPRRTAYILKRATVKFPGDLAVWLAYVEYASREGMRKVVLKGLNSALHHHPLSSTLYLLLSYHHLHPNSPFPGSSIPSSSKLDLPAPRRHGDDDEEDDDDDDTNASGFSLEGTASARTNFLLGLRMIPKSQDLWREYIKLELGWVEGLRRRWQVLGVNIGEPNGTEVDPEALTGGEGSFGPEGEDARKAILSGQLIVHAINSALEAIPIDIPFRTDLLDMLRIYPSALRTKCLGVVYDDLRRISDDPSVSKSNAARASFTLITKELYDRPYNPEVKDEGGVVLQGAELVDAVGKIGKEIKAGLKHGKGGPEWAELAGQWLLEQIALASSNDFLRRYLLSIMTSLTKPAYRPSALLLLAHLDALRSAGSEDTVLVESARSHAAQYPANPVLQRLRLELERSSPNIDAQQLRPAFKSAMKNVLVNGLEAPAQAAVRSIYVQYFDWEEEQADTVNAEADATKRLDALYRQTIRDTLRQSAIPHLHDAVLTKYFDWQIRRRPDQLLHSLEQIARTYRPSQLFYREAFDAIAATATVKDLGAVYELWRSASKTGEAKVAAVLHWATWQLHHGSGAGAADAVDIMRRELRGDAAAADQLERGWAAALDRVEQRPEVDSSLDGDEDEEGDVDMEDGSGSESQSEQDA